MRQTVKLALMILLMLVAIAPGGWLFEEIDFRDGGHLTERPAVHFSPDGTLYLVFIDSASSQLFLYEMITPDNWSNQMLTNDVYDYGVDFGFDDNAAPQPVVFAYNASGDWINYFYYTSSWQVDQVDPNGIGVNLHVQEHHLPDFIPLATQVLEASTMKPTYAIFDKGTYDFATLTMVHSYTAAESWARAVHNQYDGYTYVFYVNETGDLVYESELDFSGSGAMVNPGSLCNRQFDADNGQYQLFVAYYNDGTDNLEVFSADADSMGGWFQVDEILPGGGGYTFPLGSIALDVYLDSAQDLPQVVFTADDGGGPAFYHARFDGTQWYTTHLGGAEGDNYLLDFALDATGHPYIVHYHNQGTYDDTVKLIYCDNFPPDFFKLTSPVDGATVTTDTPTFEWETSMDFEGGDVFYTLRLALDEAMETLLHEFDADVSTVYIPTADEALHDGEYWWNVIAADDADQQTWSQSKHFLTVDADDTPFPDSAEAFAYDDTQGIQDGDWVEIVFSEQIDGPPTIDGSNIDAYLPLEGGHSWTDGNGQIQSAVWGYNHVGNDTLLVYLSTGGGAPTVEVGDVIDFSNAPSKFYDLSNNPINGAVTITGNFGPQGPEFDAGHQFIETLEYGQDNEITCTFMPDQNVDSCEVYWAYGGTTDFGSFAMTEDVDGWNYTLPAAQVSTNGIAYGFHAVSPEGGHSWYPEDFSEGTHLHARVHCDVFVPDDVDIPAGDDVSAYLMMSNPFEFPADADDPESQFADDFGPYDAADWRLFGWDAGAQQYFEYDPGADNFAMKPGDGLWLIVREGCSDLDIEDCTSLKPDPADPHMIPLQAGWNLIGAPYSFFVAWEDCYHLEDANTVEPPLTWNGSDYDEDTHLLTGVGYWVWSDGEDILYVPPIASDPGDTGGGDGFAPLTPDQRPSGGALPDLTRSLTPTLSVPGNGDASPPLVSSRADHGDGWGDPRRWRIAFSLSDGAAADGRHILGVDPAAGDYHDALERHEPPNLGERPLLWFEHDDWPSHRGRYATDLRRPFDDGSSYSFHLQAAGPAELSWNIENGWPAGFGALLELPDGRVVDLLAQSRLTIDEVLTSSGLPFTVHIGTAEYLDGEYVADRFTLAQSYPNPAAGLVRIEYELPRSGNVELAVYDIAGRRVATLHSGEQTSGRHAVAWDTAAVTPGVYLYRLSCDDARLTRRLVVQR